MIGVSQMKDISIHNLDVEIIKQGRDNLQDLLNGNEYEVNRIYALIGFLDWMIYVCEKEKQDDIN